jgi:hypothetical protein
MADMVKVFEGRPHTAVVVAGLLEASRIPHEGSPLGAPYGTALMQTASILVAAESAEEAQTLIASALSESAEQDQDAHVGSYEQVVQSIRRDVAVNDPLVRYIAAKARQRVGLPTFILLLAFYLAYAVGRQSSDAIRNGALVPVVAVVIVSAYFWLVNRLDPVSKLVFREWNAHHRRQRIWTNILSVFSGVVLLLSALGAREDAESQIFIVVPILVAVGLIVGGVGLLVWKAAAKRSASAPRPSENS